MGFFTKTPKEKEISLEQAEKINRIILTTVDLKQEYDILDIIISEEMTGQLAGFISSKKDLQKKAYELGADAVIGMKCVLTNGSSPLGMLRWYGTAVKLK